MRRFIPVALALLAMTAPSFVEAQVEISARGASLRFGGRLHAQYQASSVENSTSDFFIRRARFNGDWTFNDFLSGRIMTEFVGGTATLLDAYVQLDFAESFVVQFGQTKRAFDLIELMSSTDLSIIERTGNVRGYSECPGVGGICTYSRLSEVLLLGNRDTGVRVEGTVGRFGYMASLTNGRPPTIRDENSRKSAAVRATFDVTDAITIGANVQNKDYLEPDDATAHAFAWGADVEIGEWRDGLKVIGGIMGGDNWRSLDSTTQPGQYLPGSFLAGEVYVSYYLPLENDKIVALEPVGRFSYANPDDSIDNSGGTLITPGLMAYILGKNKIGFNWDYYMPQTGDAVHSLRLQTFLYF
jgi:hypothetical protein